MDLPGTDELVRRLRADGHRSTRPRRAVWRVLASTDEHLTVEVKRAARYGRALSLTIFDLDGFHIGPLFDPIQNMVLGGSGRDFRAVIVNGRVVVRDGQLPGVDAHQPALRMLGGGGDDQALGGLHRGNQGPAHAAAGTGDRDSNLFRHDDPRQGWGATGYDTRAGGGTRNRRGLDASSPAGLAWPLLSIRPPELGTMATPHRQTVQKISRGLKSRYPLFYVIGWDEDRIERLLRSVARSYFGADDRVRVWSTSTGFGPDDDPGAPTTDPGTAVARIAAADLEPPLMYVLKDLPTWFENNPALVRGLAAELVWLEGALAAAGLGPGGLLGAPVPTLGPDGAPAPDR